MSSTRRRTTRSASRALSESSEPVENASSVQSSKPESRRKRKSDKHTVSVPKETYSYGTDIPGTHSQQLAAQAAMMKPVRDIETGVEQAARDAAGEYGRDLSAIAEEMQTGEGIMRRYQTFGREDGDSLNTQSWRQSRASSIDRNLFEQSNNNDSTWGSAWDSTWDSIRGSIPGFFKFAGWLLLIFPITATVISLYFIARWYPIMKDLQASGFNCSSPATSECSPPATFEVERLGRRLESLEDQFRRLPRNGETAARPTLRQINWFSYDLGARAIPHLSSPTEYFQKEQAETKPIRTLRKPRWWNFWGGRFETFEVVEGEPNIPVKFEKIDYGPNSALQPWRENEPRYCTPGKLQLAVKLPRPITPLNLVMEYYLKDEVLAVGAAPKEVELWIPISDNAAHAAVVLAVTDLYPGILAVERSARFLEQNRALDSNWVPVGRWTYDIYANEIAQKFHLHVDLESHGIAVDEIVVRVNSNWANRDVTCVVRTRMYGIDQSGMHEKLDARRDESGRR